eukprot:7376167-Prymnesium_polylepis.1
MRSASGKVQSKAPRVLPPSASFGSLRRCRRAERDDAHVMLGAYHGGRWPMLSPKAVSGDYACPA